MEDSLELPDQVQEIQINTLLSPAPIGLDSRQTTPPHSLAYSNSTGVKDRRDVQMRSPLGFDQSPHKMGLIKTNNENYPLNQQMLSPERDRQQAGRVEKNEVAERAANRAQYKKVQPKIKKTSKSPVQSKNTRVSPNIEAKQGRRRSDPATNVVKTRQTYEQRKTVEKHDQVPLQRRVRQLEQALHMETVLSEQLRTKLAVTNHLLESKLQESSLGHFLSMKNSSRDLKNIDIFVEMTSMQKSMLEKNIIIDRLKSQIREEQLQHEKFKLMRVNTSNNSPFKNSPNRTLNEQMQKLMQEKQSLMSYIDEQKMKLKSKIEYIVELEEEVNRLSDKETHYRDVQRPKLVQELGQLRRQHKRMKEEGERDQLERNLDSIQAQQEIRVLQETIQTMNNDKKHVKKVEAISTSQSGVQKDDIEKELLLKELTLLQNERDYYLKEYRKRTDESAQLYSLQLKLAVLKTPQQ